MIRLVALNLFFALLFVLGLSTCVVYVFDDPALRIAQERDERRF